MKEKWLLITNWENYAVSNTGKIKNIKTGKLLKLFENKSGYLTVSLCQNRKQATFRVHRLVALMFIDNPDCKKEVNHKDGNKKNNNINNLEWMTHKENDAHARKNGLKHENKPVKLTNLKTKEYDASSYSGWVDNNSGDRIYNAPYTTVNGFGVQRIAERWRDISQRVTIEANTVYTLSAWIKWESSTSTMRFFTNTGSMTNTNVTSQVGTTDYKRVFVTFNSGDATTSTCRFECSSDTPYLIYGLKLEKGNKPTDWSPAPEDDERRIASLEARVAALEAAAVSGGE